MPGFEPTVRRQELGRELRGMRKEADFTLEEGARVINCSMSKLSRIETGHRAVTPVEVSALMAAYKADPKKRDHLLALAEEAGEIGWLQRPTEYVNQRNTLVMLESTADSIVSFQLTVIPGLLQTGEYTQALVTESGADSEGELEDTIVSRMCRQSNLLRRDPPKFLAIIDELALHRRIGSPYVLRRQLEHLIKESRRNHVTLRVVPNDGVTHSGLNGSFELIRRPGRSPVVVVEMLTAGLFVEDRTEVRAYESAYQRLLTRALDEEDSVSLVAELARRLDSETSGEWNPPTYLL